MEKDVEKKPVEKKEAAKSDYEPPRVVTFSGDDLLKELGPAQACSPFGGAVLGC